MQISDGHEGQTPLPISFSGHHYPFAVITALFVLALLAISGTLSGCGSSGGTLYSATPTPSPTSSPTATASPTSTPTPTPTPTPSPSSSPTATPTPTAVVAISLSPDAATVTAGGSATFTATVTNATDTSVIWSVQEGASGGTITSVGVYTAPATAGTYHVVATSTADTSKTATATVTVTAAVGGAAITVQ